MVMQDERQRDDATAAGPAPPAKDNAPSYLPHTGPSKALDGLIGGIGHLVSWLWIAVLLAIVVNVIWRYALHNNIGQLEELQWHLYSIAFLFGLSYAVVSDQHVRIDLLHDVLGPKLKGWIELIGILVFAIPFVSVVLWYSVPFVVTSFEHGESSVNPSGLPHRFLVKGALTVGFALLVLAFLSRLLRIMSLLFGLPKPLAAQSRGTTPAQE